MVVAAISYFAYYTMMNSDYLVSRIAKTLEGDTSNRDIIYAAAYNTWLNAENIHNTIFGFGTDGTTHLIGIRAHNDWLEILIDFGILGIFFYFSFLSSIVRTIWRNKHNHLLFYTLLAVFFIWFSKSLVSMGFTNDIFSFLAMEIGIVLGLEYRDKQGLSVLSD
jgi:O-antigen ligase